jgi:hypothetical protein
VGLGAGMGAVAGVGGGLVQGQWRDPWKLAADAAIGAASGAVGGIPGRAAAGVLVGMGASAGASVASQAVGGQGINPWAVAIDTGLGGVAPFGGAVAANLHVGNMVATIGSDVFGGLESVGCAAFSAGKC